MQTAERRSNIPRWYQIRSVEHMAHDNVEAGRLIRFAQDLPDRKTLFYAASHDQFPKPITEAIEIIHDRFATDISFNTVIVKKYVPAKPEKNKLPEPSQAFNWHVDPKEYHDEYGLGKKEMVIWTAAGRAPLEVLVDGNKPLSFDCLPNTAKKLPAHTRHRVGPPDPQWGTRIMYWFGQRD